MIEVTQTHGMTCDYVHIHARGIDGPEFDARLTRSEALDLARRIFLALDWDSGCDCATKVEALRDTYHPACDGGSAEFNREVGYDRALDDVLLILKG